MKHHPERTSPKGPGMPFIGTCRLCGKTGLKASAALDDCENVRGLSADEALIETIIGEPDRVPVPPLVKIDRLHHAVVVPVTAPGQAQGISAGAAYFASNERPWPDPTPKMLNDDPLFDAIWSVIKTWDINVPHAYSGYCGATGNHVRAIYDAISGPLYSAKEVDEAVQKVIQRHLDDGTLIAGHTLDPVSGGAKP